MSGVWTIYRRELAGLFLTPLAWVLLCLALAVHGVFFGLYLGATGGAVNEALSLALGGGTGFWILLVVLPPLLTMRMISEEARSGLLEFLLTAPVRDGAVVLGKALAATSFLVLLWSSTLVFAAVLGWHGGQPDWGQLAGSWIGATLVSGLFCAVGLAASASSAVPLLAAFLAFVANVTWILLPLLGHQLQGAWRERFDAAVARLDLVSHLQGSFATGAFDSADAVFFLAWTGVFLFLATRLVEAKRWR